ncbi:unnamed protein product, partial [Prunus brigantina]
RHGGLFIGGLTHLISTFWTCFVLFFCLICCFRYPKISNVSFGI